MLAYIFQDAWQWNRLIQRGTTEESKTMASKASRNAKHDSKELPRIVPPLESSACAVNVLFLMLANYRYVIPPPKFKVLPLFLCE